MSEGGSVRPVEKWGSKIGVILAVAGSAVGLGNFLRFPGQAAKYGGGAFMIPYFIAFVIVGIPICWAEWTMGRYGGRFGFNSAPGIFSVLWRRNFSKFFGALGLLIPVIIYMYYVYIEAWCLAYACNYLAAALGISQQVGLGNGLDLGKNPAAYGQFFVGLTGIAENGAVFTGKTFSACQILFFFCITFVVNFVLVYRGLTKGIERFCKFAMPLLILAAVVVVGRVLTLPEQPLSEPWQQSLPKALPPAMWEELRDASLAEDAEPSRVHEKLDATFERYFEAIRTGDADGFQTDVAVSPPAAFAASDRGISVAMAELRAGDVGEEYRDWIQQGRTSLSDDEKLQLQTLEREQLGLDSESTGFESKRDKLREDRAAVLSRIGMMPNFHQQIRSVNGNGSLAESEATALQRRSAALELSELPRTVWNGLGYMWNPSFDELKEMDVWIAATGQIFFSLSVGFGIVLCYASYLRRNDDVVLSGLTASTMNEFCEVVLGGLVAIPATFIFLGTATTLTVINSGSTFGLGFNTLPAVFANMPAGLLFGAVWFGLLFLAGITSSLSMLQPAIAFIEEGFGIRRRGSVAALGLLTISGSLAVLYFSKNVAALDTMDFWVGSVAIYLLATIQVIVFAWVFGIERGFEEAHRGANMTIPGVFRFVLKFVTPVYLVVIFVLWAYHNLPSYASRILGDPASLLTVLYLVIVLAFLVLMVGLAGEQWRKQGLGESEVDL